MNILHLSSAHSWRGGEQQIAYLIDELNTKNCRQWVLCPKGSAFEKHCLQQNIIFQTYRKMWSVNPLVGRHIKQIIRKEKIDLLHVHDSHAHTFACLAAEFWGLKIPIVLSRRVDFPIQKTRLSLWKYNHPSIKAILCVSEFIRKIITPDIKESDKIYVVHSGIDVQKFSGLKKNILRKEFTIPNDQFLIANVASIAPHKDYFTFINTADILINRGLKVKFLIIGGDGGEQKSIEHYIRQRKISQHILLTGFRKDIPQLLPEIDLLLFTSKTEGLGTTLLDAIACNVPIVATRAGGIPEIIEHGRNGLLAPVGDAQLLADHVQTLLKDKMMQQRFINNGIIKLEQFSKKQTAEKTWQIYQHVLKK